jgi:hypothetical protein
MSGSNVNGSKNMSVTIIPVTVNGREAYAVVDSVTGKWGHTKTGNASFAFGYEKAKEIAHKAVSFTEVPPPGFSAFGHGKTAVRPVVVPTPSVVVTDNDDCSAGDEAKKPRSVKQAAAWLKVCESNLTRFLAGEFRGGDEAKYRKSVETARASLEAAQAREAGSDNDSN